MDLFFVLACLLQAAPARTGMDERPVPTFTKDIAPLVFENCAPCHRPGEAAPFSLLDYEDVRSRARQIALVTERRLMPPWLPDSTLNRFEGDRSLRDEEIEALRRWVEAGCPEGEAADLPPRPEWSDGWQLGEPDHIVAMSEPYVVPAEGKDVYRNFVIPSAVQGTHFVRAVEFRADNRSVLHHGVLFVDGSGLARADDLRDPEPGYPAMGLGTVRIPNGQFIGWTPGKNAAEGRDGVAWRIDEHLDIVLQLHLRPTGKEEEIRVTLGLHFAEEPPKLHPMAIRLWSREIDIPAGEPAYVVENDYELPVDVQVLGVYPHAHYLGKDLDGHATLPDGSVQSLVRIRAWDFSWQQEYFYEEPLFLPKGTRISTRYLYDNSESNPANPNQPPKRVKHGYQSSDEMAELGLQVLPGEGDRPILWNDFTRKAYEVDLAHVENLLRERPDSTNLHIEAIKYCLRLDWTDEARGHCNRLIELHPESADGLQWRGQVELAAGNLEEAVRDLQESLGRDPSHRKARLHLGRAFHQQGRLDEARRQLRKVLDKDPGNFLANTTLGEIAVERGDLEEAAARFEAALADNPEHLRALWQLAGLRLQAGRSDEALELCERVLEIAPDDAWGHATLARVLESKGDLEGARFHVELALRFEPGRAELEELQEHLQAGQAADR